MLIACALNVCLAVAGTMYKSDVEASYYADKFHGRQTANGEIFNMYGFTAAHRELPFNTLLRVTNLANKKSVIVRVNDRGPFVEGREIDLSRAAAEKLDMTAGGTARVSLEIVSANETENPVVATTVSPTAEPVTPTGAPTTSPASPYAPTNMEATAVVSQARWDIQLGSFSSEGNAKVLAQKLLKAGFTNVVYQKTAKSIRVVIKDVADADLATLQSELTSKGFKDQYVRERKL